MAEPSTRVRRVAEGIREEVSGFVAQRLNDPRARGAVVTRVEMTSDLRTARIHVRLLENGEDLKRRRELVNALARAAGLLRREVGKRLRLRYAPELRFTYDDGGDHLSRVEELLHEIEDEKKR